MQRRKAGVMQPFQCLEVVVPLRRCRLERAVLLGPKNSQNSSRESRLPVAHTNLSPLPISPSGTS
jgi:hypothetical protein